MNLRNLIEMKMRGLTATAIHCQGFLSSFAKVQRGAKVSSTSFNGSSGSGKHSKPLENESDVKTSLKTSFFKNPSLFIVLFFCLWSSPGFTEPISEPASRGVALSRHHVDAFGRFTRSFVVAKLIFAC